MSKHDIKSQEILNSAFRIWGGCRYMNTSLSELGAAQNLTKQALYRYFPSKERLEQAMEEDALGRFEIHSNNMLDKLSTITGDGFADAYISGNLDFITGNGFRLGFLSYRYRGKPDGPPILRELTGKFNRLALLNGGIPDVGMRYLNTLTFILAHQRNADWKSAWNEGFASSGLSGRPDYDQMLSDASVVDYSIFTGDPLVNAVFDTVMEEAGNDVSLGRVARRAGLTKSSLYNYWPSKEAMLIDVLDRQMTQFIGLFEQFAGRYDRPEDRIFAYLAFTGTFLRRTPEILNYLQRIMSYGIQIPRDKSVMVNKFITPLNAVMDSGLLNLHGFDDTGLLGLVNLAGVTEIKHHLTEKSARIRIEQGLKDLYLLIMGGITALRRTM